MGVFNNKNPESPIETIEFADSGQNHFVILHTKARMEQPKIQQWLQKNGQNFKEITRTHVDGHEVIITQSEIAQPQLIQALQSHGDTFQEHFEKNGTNLWKLRGWASIIGQPMQLISGMMQKGTIDPATIGFASANMLANITNIVFGAEKKVDPNREVYLKNEVNRDLDEHLPGQQPLFEPSEKRLEARGDASEKEGPNFIDFMRKNSVRIGEIGLRYIGALSLAFPFVKAIKGVKPWSAEGLTQGTAHWKQAAGQLTSGKFIEAFKTIANKDTFTFGAGMAYLGGKTLAFASKIPDPYDPKPHTAVDIARENVVFPISSMIEAVAAGLISYNGFFNRKINWNQKYIPKAMHFGETRDYMAGIGGALFTAGLIIRIFAPFGKNELNMNEVAAHISDTVAKTPAHEMPRLMADSAATVFEHSKDSGMTFGQVFAAVARDMEKHHHIALHPQATPTDLAKANAPEASDPARFSERMIKAAPNFADRPLHSATGPTQVAV